VDILIGSALPDAHPADSKTNILKYVFLDLSEVNIKLNLMLA